jgi:GNAT superfamily N-acetyltransferase
MDNLGHMGAPSAIAEDVMVDPRWHGRGVGQAMMEHAMKVAQAAGAYKLALSSNAKREKPHALRAPGVCAARIQLRHRPVG